MTVDELRAQLADVPGAAVVALEYEAGCCFDDEVAARVDEDGVFVIFPADDLR